MKILNLKTALVIACLIVLGSCASTVTVSKFLSTTSKTDPDSIPLTDLVYDSKNKLFYQVLNNEREIILLMKITDENMQRKIMRMGLTVWLDPSAKRNKDYGVRFPIGGFFERQPGRAGFERGRQQEQLFPKDMVLIGLGEGVGNEQVVTADQPGHIRAKISYDNFQTLIYHLIIPQDILNSREKLKDGSLLSIGIETNEIETGPGAARGYGMGGGNMRGRRPGERNNHEDFSQMITPVKIWLTTKLNN